MNIEAKIAKKKARISRLNRLWEDARNKASTGKPAAHAKDKHKARFSSDGQLRDWYGRYAVKLSHRMKDIEKSIEGKA
jgi:hypothetical protein